VSAGGGVLWLTMAPTGPEGRSLHAMVRLAVVLCVLSAAARLLGLDDVATDAALAAAAAFVLAAVVFGIVLLVSVGGAARPDP
jgi:NAD/NADP transhydrogenase beta subunit